MAGVPFVGAALPLTSPNTSSLLNTSSLIQCGHHREVLVYISILTGSHVPSVLCTTAPVRRRVGLCKGGSSILDK